MRIFTNWHTPAQAESGLREHLPEATVDRVMDAVGFARAWHGAQVRPTGAPYLEHLLEALEVLVAGAGVTDPDVLTAAVLHDVVEDTDCTTAQVAERFGVRVAGLVGWVTIPPAGPGEDKLAVKQASLRRLASAPHDAVLVKLADRVSNVQTLRKLTPDKQRSYYAQTVEFIVPLAEAEPWFATWYQDWSSAHADLAAPPDRR
ncbi:MAG TPA: HD domain-containing protein [Streptosporangiaceae bacterium]